MFRKLTSLKYTQLRVGALDANVWKGYFSHLYIRFQLTVACVVFNIDQLHSSHYFRNSKHIFSIYQNSRS